MLFDRIVNFLNRYWLIALIVHSKMGINRFLFCDVVELYSHF